MRFREDVVGLVVVVFCEEKRKREGKEIERLSAEDMRQHVHPRWNIENRTFRRFNHLVRGSVS